jgi:hypothetical protein
LVDVRFDEWARVSSKSAATSCHASYHFARDIFRDIPRPPFGRVERDSTYRGADQ